MEVQIDLWDRMASHHRGNTESAAAYERLIPHLPGLQGRVLMAIAVAGEQGATVKEIESSTRITRLTVGARLTELKESGLIDRAAGIRREGCAAWRLTEEGLKQCRAR